MATLADLVQQLDQTANSLPSRRRTKPQPQQSQPASSPVPVVPAPLPTPVVATTSELKIPGPNRSLNWYKGIVDKRDYRSTFNIKKIGESVDLSPGFVAPIKDQKFGNSVAMACVQALEYAYKTPLSARFTYYNARVKIAGWSAADSGSFIRDTLRAITKFGCCPEELFSDSSSDFTEQPRDSLYSSAIKPSTCTFSAINDNGNKRALILDVKKCLAAGIPIIAGLTCTPSIWSPRAGVIDMPSDQRIGGQAILIVGYDDKSHTFKIRNSWGTSWGIGGYARLPYEYWYKGYLSDLWFITTDPSLISDVSIINPVEYKKLVRSSVADVMEKIHNSSEAILADGGKDFFVGLRTDYKHIDDQRFHTFLATLQNSFQQFAQ
jgi:hypothetical protein